MSHAALGVHTLYLWPDHHGRAALRRLHDDLVRRQHAWRDRFEVAYLSTAAFPTFKGQASRIAIISPGEPLHFVDAGCDWFMNWYLVQESDTTLFGPPSRDLIALMSEEEFIATVREHA